ncbi:MAG: aldehyde ferredoxin oxidoreductase C-terminal domain-containing protein, partial [Nitrospinota bacterium]
FAHLCNEQGLDEEGLGNTIAFAIECFERGLIGEKDTVGLRLGFGDPGAFLALAEKIAGREGVGDLLAEGSLRAAREIGRGAERYAIQVKGVEMSAADPRGMPLRAVSYATSTRGSDHLRSNPYIEEIATPEEALRLFGTEEAADLKATGGKGRLLKWSEDFVTIGDLLGICKFAYYRSASWEHLYRKGVELARRFLAACTGRELTDEELLRCGERTFNVEKAYNVRAGAGREQDIVPERFFEEPLLGGGPSGGALVRREDFDRILEDYYEDRGWNRESGLPKREKLRELGLEDIEKALAERGLLG